MYRLVLGEATNDGSIPILDSTDSVQKNLIWPPNDDHDLFYSSDKRSQDPNIFAQERRPHMKSSSVDIAIYSSIAALITIYFLKLPCTESGSVYIAMEFIVFFIYLLLLNNNYSGNIPVLLHFKYLKPTNISEFIKISTYRDL